jgi:hypothetical protein
MYTKIKEFSKKIDNTILQMSADKLNDNIHFRKYDEGWLDCLIVINEVLKNELKNDLKKDIEFIKNDIENQIKNFNK